MSSASLRAFRALFGLIMAASTLRFLAHGWVQALLTPYHFTYPGFAFVEPLPAPWLYALFGLLVAASLGLALGCRPRLCASLFCVGFTYVELIDQTRFLNHYYLVSLLAFLLALVPWGASTVPRAYLYALRFQVAVVYVFAGLAKLNHDWLVEAQPLTMWLAARSELPVVGRWLAEPATAHVFSLAGAAFDLAVVPCLLAGRTRPYALAAALVFHVVTGFLFPIGVFPWLMSACLTLFLPASWPERWLPALSGQSPTRAPLALLVAHCLVQVVVPLRQHLESDSAWTYRGFDFAWRVMVAEKSGAVRYETEEHVTIAPSRYLTPDQERAFARDPALIWALGQHIASELSGREGRAVPVFAHAFASLNGQPSQRLVDPSVDLAHGDPPPGWILQRGAETDYTHASLCPEHVPEL